MHGARAFPRSLQLVMEDFMEEWVRDLPLVSGQAERLGYLEGEHRRPRVTV